MGNKAPNSKLNCGSMLGVILAGGQSRRMDGTNKALMQLGGQPMVVRAIDRLLPQVGSLIVSSNQTLAVVSVRNIPVIADTLPDYPGPLAGLLAAMAWAKGNQPDVEWVCCVSVDTPLFPQDLVAQLQQGLAEDVLAVCARSQGRRHPTIGLFHISLAGHLREFLTSGGRKVGQWVDEIGAQAVDFQVEEADPFFNVNTPGDLQNPILLAALD